jgi:hypothetical protein
LDKHDKLQQKWQGTPTGEAIQEIRRLHEALAEQTAREQEDARERIADLVRALRQSGVFGQYDPYQGRFIEERPAKKVSRRR